MSVPKKNNLADVKKMTEDIVALYNGGKKISAIKYVRAMAQYFELPEDEEVTSTDYGDQIFFDSTKLPGHDRKNWRVEKKLDEARQEKIRALSAERDALYASADKLTDAIYELQANNDTPAIRALRLKLSGVLDLPY